MAAQYSTRLIQAFEFAATEHICQTRKDTTIPYISHLMSVSALVYENGGVEDQAIAGLLHDVIEDADPPSRVPLIRREIKEKFGAKVLDLVEGCTDGEADEAGVKAPWRERKETYLKALENKSEELLLVSCCDKLHNARAILTDLNSIGKVLFERFTGKEAGTLWYYQTLVEIFQQRLPNVVAVRELAATVAQIQVFGSQN